MSKVDTAWLRMESPTNLMMITGVLLFHEPLNMDRLKQTIEERFLNFPRFRYRAVDHLATAHWEMDDNFDIDTHVKRVALPGKADLAALQSYVSDLASTPLDQAHPLWQFHYIENYRDGYALVQRIHHCYADGMALVQVMLSMTDADAGHHRQRPHGGQSMPHFQSGVVERLLAPVRKQVDGALALGHMAIEEGTALLKNPGKVNAWVGEGAEILKDLAISLTLSNDPETRFRGPLTSRKQVAWCDPLPLDEVRSLSHAYGCKVNDLLIAAATGALREYLMARGDCVDDMTIRATVPVNLRPLEHARELGNHFGLVFLDLPLGEDNPLGRVVRVKAAMDQLKQSKQAVVALGLLAALGRAPGPAQEPALEMLSRKASTVLTNVPGPTNDLYFAGSRIDQMMFWVPQSGSIGMGISILSYRGMVQFGLMADAGLVTDPGEITDRFAGEFEKLVKIALMLPWTTAPTPLQAEMLLD